MNRKEELNLLFFLLRKLKTIISFVLKWLFQCENKDFKIKNSNYAKRVFVMIIIATNLNYHHQKGGTEVVIFFVS